MSNSSQGMAWSGQLIEGLGRFLILVGIAAVITAVGQANDLEANFKQLMLLATPAFTLVGVAAAAAALGGLLKKSGG